MRTFLAAAAALFSLFSGLAIAQDEYPFIPESYPPHIESRIAMQDASLQLSLVSLTDEFFIDAVRVWPVGALNVCFFGGSAALRAQIAAAANGWAQVGASISFDFGDLANPRLCSPTVFSQIRVGFAYAGYWSTVGTDSITLVPQNEQSMNFSLFNVNPPTDPKFSQIVLHEFGHALGFKHEHQSYKAPCPNEFDWPRIYTYLQGPPNNWTIEQIDHNLRPVMTGDAGDFDNDSIMLYSFPASFYLAGTDAACYTGANFVLSKQDRAGLLKYYPQSAVAAAAVRTEIFADFQAQVDGLPIGDAARDIAKAKASSLLLPEMMSPRFNAPVVFETPNALLY